MLIKILEIIGYSEDKDKFAMEFLENVGIKAQSDLIGALPQDKKDQLQQKIQSLGNDAAKVQGELLNYFTQDQIGQAIENSSKNAVTDYVKTIEPTLSDPQKTALAAYFTEIAPTPAPVAV